MGAAQPGREAETIGTAVMQHPSRATASPVYAAPSADRDSRIFAGSAADRNVANQLVQWLIIFAVVGVPIVGAKWWNARQSVAGAELAANPPGIGDVIVDPPPAPVAVVDPKQQAEVPAAYPPTSSQTAQVALAAADAPIVRAPAEVPYPARTLDIVPSLPEGAAVPRGIAVLSLLIDTLGNVVEVELLRSVDPALDAAAVAAARQWKFEPTTRDGRPVAVRSNFTVPFGY